MAFKPGRQFHRINWGIFSQAFAKNPLPTINTPEEAMVAATELSSCFEQAIETAVPWSRPNQKSKIWWTPEISNLKAILNAAKQQAQQDLTREEAKEHQREWGRQWRKAQWDH